ncbi:LOW QUALITY PROTEIN: hypothetical protein Cgig2_032120 [Carnegiea gigantea]|uniref:Uncharacterized protein n=1 Tax=Carnegiea gigantea TaxID=171969 RepID=A0A9Q1QLT9_9CARY|nr:LOW QUALITY PROTEIN: hypothetical protein Cgig2_032120 [Carnegiea gigantea]
MKKLKINSYVYSIKDEHDQMVYGFNKAARVTAKFYNKLLETQSHDMAHIDRDIMDRGAKLSIEQQPNVYGPFSERDIKEAIFSILNVKLPRPDCYSSISWANYCKPKSHWGIGLKNLGIWNQARVAKLMWQVALKKKQLWLKWVYGTLNQRTSGITPPPKNTVTHTRKGFAELRKRLNRRTNIIDIGSGMTTPKRNTQ